MNPYEQVACQTCGERPATIRAGCCRGKLICGLRCPKHVHKMPAFLRQYLAKQGDKR